MASKAQTSGFVIAAKADESEPDILVDELHPCVCPNCGISKFEEGHEKDIITNEEIKRWNARCWGGFGVARYRFLPHKCKACDTVFAPWIVEKKANISVIGGYIGLIFSLAFAIITLMLAIMDEFLLLLIFIIMLCFSAGCIAGIHFETAEDLDIEKYIADLLKYEDIADEYLDPDDEEDGIEGLDSALQHIKEVLGDDETEDLNITFDGVSMKQAASACKDLATANMSEPKNAMEVFDTLTPEQKSVVYYLIGGTVAASEEEILAMQHIQDQVQSNAAKRMNDIWRLHV